MADDQDRLYAFEMRLGKEVRNPETLETAANVNLRGQFPLLAWHGTTLCSTAEDCKQDAEPMVGFAIDVGLCYAI